MSPEYSRLKYYSSRRRALGTGQYRSQAVTKRKDCRSPQNAHVLVESLNATRSPEYSRLKYCNSLGTGASLSPKRKDCRIPACVKSLIPSHSHRTIAVLNRGGGLFASAAVHNGGNPARGRSTSGPDHTSVPRPDVCVARPHMHAKDHPLHKTKRKRKRRNEASVLCSRPPSWPTFPSNVTHTSKRPTTRESWHVRDR